jgi:hypothetical protein
VLHTFGLVQTYSYKLLLFSMMIIFLLMFIRDRSFAYVGDAFINVFFSVLILENSQFVRLATFQMKYQTNVILPLLFVQ